MRNHMAAGWFYSPSQISRYLSTRVTSLKRPKIPLKNPITLFGLLSCHQWLMFISGFVAWVWDSFDFFTVSLTTTELAEAFNVKNSDVTWGITVTLMLRPVGAFLCGVISDRYGRKWPMIVTLFFFVVLELGSGFCETVSQFMAVRALYGIAMGGLYGPAVATALEDLPFEAKGLFSGFFQIGYPLGDLLAAAFYRALVPTTPEGWRSLFFFGAAPQVLMILLRWYLPDTAQFQATKAQREAAATTDNTGHSPRQSNVFLKDAARVIGKNWVLFIYLVMLTTAFNFCTHGSSDFYPTFLRDQVGLDATFSSITVIVGQAGAIVGGLALGYTSTFLGRRLTMLIACVFGGSILPAYILLRSKSLSVSGFFQHIFVGGVWGPMPIYLLEMSPAETRTFMAGLTYQLGNLGASASATIQSTMGEKYPLPPSADGTKRFDYAKVIAIFLGVIWAIMPFLILVGAEMTQGEREEEAARLQHPDGQLSADAATLELKKRELARQGTAHHTESV
ncbi:hypothetical protein N7456_011343 [Penicillium angulare]|uniref:Major facilitator superfamily (MFS) profile domain-containing protein n=1 Tax=Penicillium angulare TaxID=116970 RepID=A0A9W9ETF9_9EURO|nr:hypothetical protein N7456_011343 [Penicillium angulare]